MRCRVKSISRARQTAGTLKPPRENTLSQQIPVGTVLGGRYEVTAHIIITAESDMVLEGIDQILNRKVSVVVASPNRSALLEVNTRALATTSQGNIQILDLGITPEGSRYLVTSHTRPDLLLDTLLVENHSLSNAEDALGAEIFGDSEGGSSPNTYEKVSSNTTSQEVITAAKNWNAPSGRTVTAYSEPTSIYEDDEDEEEGSRGTWAVAMAAVLLLVIVAGGILASLGALGSNQSAAPAPKTSESTSEPAAAEAPAAPTEASASSTPSETPSPNASNAPAKIASVARFSPSNPTFMSDMDSLIPNLTDGNAGTPWLSYGFGASNYAGSVQDFGLALKLQTPTVISKLTIQQNTGTGGSFTVYTNSSASLSGAVEVGKGTFEGKDSVVTLDTSKQNAEKGAYVIIVVNELPRLSQPIAGYSYGLRINELKVD